MIRGTRQNNLQWKFSCVILIIIMLNWKGRGSYSSNQEIRMPNIVQSENSECHEIIDQSDNSDAMKRENIIEKGPQNKRYQFQTMWCLIRFEWRNVQRHFFFNTLRKVLSQNPLIHFVLSDIPIIHFDLSDIPIIL